MQKTPTTGDNGIAALRAARPAAVKQTVAEKRIFGDACGVC